MPRRVICEMPTMLLGRSLAPCLARAKHRHPMSGPVAGGCEILFGVHPCLLALQRASRHVTRAFVRKDYYHCDQHDGGGNKTFPLVKQILQLVEERDIPLMLYNRAALSFIAKDRPHQGICLEVTPKETSDCEPLDDLEGIQHLPVLDRIRDPMNLGAVLRTCYFFGVNKVVITPHTCTLSPMVSKASSGALELMDVHLAHRPEEFLARLKQDQSRMVLGTSGPAGENSVPLTQVTPSSNGRTAIVFGFEGTGVDKDILESCDQVVAIEGARNSAVDSLNISTAFAIFLHHMYSMSRN